jgi:hypothetical protein
MNEDADQRETRVIADVNEMDLARLLVLRTYIAGRVAEQLTEDDADELADLRGDHARSRTHEELVAELASEALNQDPDQAMATANAALEAAERLRRLGLGAITTPLTRLLESLATHAEDQVLYGALPLRVRQLAEAITTTPEAGGRVPHADAVTAAVGQALLMLNADPELEPRTAWYAEHDALGAIDRGQGVRERYSLVRLHDEAAIRADLLDDVHDGEAYRDSGDVR